MTIVKLTFFIFLLECLLQFTKTPFLFSFVLFFQPSLLALSLLPFLSLPVLSLLSLALSSETLALLGFLALTALQLLGRLFTSAPLPVAAEGVFRPGPAAPPEERPALTKVTAQSAVTGHSQL